MASNTENLRPRHPEKVKNPDSPLPRKPDWIRVKAPSSVEYFKTRSLMRELDLVTVCEEAACPNIGECWSQRHATMMILGSVCTRACAFCNVATGMPDRLDPHEPERVGEAVARLGLRHVVITSVDSDDLKDGGAAHFAAVITSIRNAAPDTTIEVLTPDFQGHWDDLRTVLDAGPAVLNHNIETVRRVFKSVRAKGDYDLSLELLRVSRESHPGIPTKSGMMVGLGETREEISQTMADLRAVGVDLLTVGQYLRPTRDHVTMDRFYHPREFREIEEEGYALGFKHVASGPLVRSSYHADDQLAAARGVVA